MTKIVFVRKGEHSREAELLAQGYVRRTTIGEPRLSELVAEYERIGFDVQVIEHHTQTDDCGVCFDAGKEVGQVFGDVYVRNRRRGAGPSTSGD